MKYPFQLTPTTIKINKLVLGLSVILLLLFGSPIHWLVAFGIYVIKGLLGTAVIHRGLSHKAFKMSKRVEYLLAAIALAGTNSTVITWVSVHRQHHRNSDQPGDPHSPLHMSYLDVQFMRFKSPLDIFSAPDLIRQPFYTWLHRWHFLISLVIATVLFFIDPLAVLYCWLVPNFIQSHAGTTVNGLNHLKFGYRNFDTKDNSHNNWITGILCLGEGWHNNHHNDPANANFSVKWWEFDLGYYVTKLIRQR